MKPNTCVVYICASPVQLPSHSLCACTVCNAAFMLLHDNLLQAPQSLVRCFASSSWPHGQPEQPLHVRRHFSKQREGSSPDTPVDVDVEGAAAVAGAPDAAAAGHEAAAAAERGPASGIGEEDAVSAEADELQAALVAKDKEVRFANACLPRR